MPHRISEWATEESNNYEKWRIHDHHHSMMWYFTQSIGKSQISIIQLFQLTNEED
jgi:hypothetical protein